MDLFNRFDGKRFGFASKNYYAEFLAAVDVEREYRQRVSAERQRSEEHTSELQSLMRISYAVFCLKKKTKRQQHSKDRESHTRITCRPEKHTDKISQNNHNTYNYQTL